MIRVIDGKLIKERERSRAREAFKGLDKRERLALLSAQVRDEKQAWFAQYLLCEPTILPCVDKMGILWYNAGQSDNIE